MLNYVIIVKLCSFAVFLSQIFTASIAGRFIERIQRSELSFCCSEPYVFVIFTRIPDKIQFHYVACPNSTE